MKKHIILTILMICFFFPGYANADDTDVTKKYLTTYYSSWATGGDDGSSYDTTSSWSKEIPGDKISSITFYKKSSKIKGFEIKYLYGGSTSVGSLSGNSTTVNFGGNEYITKGWFYKKKKSGHTCITRVRLQTNIGGDYWWGKDNNWEKGTGWSAGSTGIVGFWGKAKDRLDSIGLIAATPWELECLGVEFTNTVGIGTAEQAFLSDNIGFNNTDLEQSMDLRMTYTEGDSSTDSWSNTYGITETMGVKIGIEVKNAAFGGVSEEWSYSVTNSWSDTVGKSSTTNSSTSNTSAFSLNVPAKTIYAMKTTVYQSTATFPYIATFKNTWDNKVFELEGKLDNATSVSTYVEWLDIGYFDDNGNKIIHDEFKDDWGTITLNDTNPGILTTTKLNTSEKLDIDSINISKDDPRWVMSDEEIIFRQQNGLD
ncbi:MAG: hypothetical protein GY710_13905 [Desulfobacteraceae bacterium]|nr:hypothetical protein [Desulfobacteraceae bacterium]